MVNAVQTMGAGSSGAETPLTRTADGPMDLGRDAFLKLLVTQLRFQDPTEPIKDRAFVAQLAQFSSLERLDELSDAMAGLNAAFGAVAQTSVGGYALSLLGRSVGLTDGSSGRVSAVSWKTGLPVLTLEDGRTVGMEDVLSVTGAGS